jgi:transcription antitermination factor NusG
MNNFKLWYVLYTKPNQEKKAQQQLNRIQIENYLASLSTTRKWSDRNKKVEEILLKSYIFISCSEKERLFALELPSIVRCLFDNGKPALVPDWQIKNLQRFLSKAEKVFVNDDNLTGRKVLIKEGPFAGVIGRIEKTLNGNFLSVHLDFVNKSFKTVVSEEMITYINIFSQPIDEEDLINNSLSEKIISY